ncbi:hypothetical protein COUCH_11555 [Couchioplanes caeruleus]|uniref:hypothetical protein n=1 Tax=Couchioplanes caeruleus TaxID=56438 RepID=UPI0020BDDD1E|nr:hypothetical protein [Couchioplanes caeruleus]UQU66857.1 hypothetical protein COUCH_11555 [Couchioplanes caeruleus]
MAVTDGAADLEWVEVPVGRWAFQRRPSQRLPLDPRTAKRTRRYVQLAPWSLLTGLVTLVAWLAAVLVDVTPSIRLTAVVVAGADQLVWLLVRRGLPRQIPYRTRFGDLRIPEVPAEVAQQWISQNPGVTATDEPPPRPHSRRFYAGWSVGLVAAAIGLTVVLANDGREDFILFWVLVPVLFVAGVSMALKAQPQSKADPRWTWPPT